MNVRGAIVSKLRADAALVAMLPSDEAIYHRTAPQDAVTPFITLHKQAGTPRYTFGDWHDDELWTVKAIDREHSASVAEAIDERVRAILQDAELVLDDSLVLYFRREQDVDYGEVDEGVVIHHIGAQYRLLRQPT